MLSLLVLPALPSSAATVTSVHYVPTTLPDDTTEYIRVEVRRDDSFDATGQGVKASMSPYNTLGDPTGTGTVVGNGLMAEGIAEAAVDVLGTRGSTGCWDYGGYNEQKAGVDAIRFLAGDIPDRDGNFLDWSNGRVGLTGVSYDGTTANMVAGAPLDMWTDERGSSIDADGTTPLKAIVPIAAISHWYGYAYSDGERDAYMKELTADKPNAPALSRIQPRMMPSRTPSSRGGVTISVPARTKTFASAEQATRPAPLRNSASSAPACLAAWLAMTLSR